MNNYNFFLLVYFVCLLLFFSSCGKHETSGGTAGTVSGVIVGEALSSKKNKGTGTVLGAMIGNYVGRKIGREEDRREQESEKIAQKEEIQELKSENNYLRKNLNKWCDNCHKRISIVGANNCPYCGTHLIKEKFCKSCLTRFNPESDYCFCPYCTKESIKLSYR